MPHSRTPERGAELLALGPGPLAASPGTHGVGGLVRSLLLAFALVGLAGLFVTLAHAGTGAPQIAGVAGGSATKPQGLAELEAVAAGLRAQHPGTRIDSVQFSPIAGLYEVVMGRNVAYMDASGRYALFGHVWDMQTRRDLTADRKALLDRIDVKAMDKALALRQVKGRGTRTLYVFADPQCSFCRQQEQALAGVDDVTIYTFVLPILGPESRRLATAIACASEPQAAWDAWMLAGQAPATPSAQAATPESPCAAGVAAVEQLAKALGITGTPTLVAEDGRKSAGAMAAAQLTAWLGSPQASVASESAGVRAAAQARPDITGRTGRAGDTGRTERTEGGIPVKVTSSPVSAPLPGR